MIKDFFFDYFNESAILDGYNYIIDSGYRSFEYQQAIWDYNVSKMGLEKTRDKKYGNTTLTFYKLEE